MRQRAFTIIELLIAVAIVGILATMAVPAYYSALLRVHRAEAKGVLTTLYGIEMAFFAERNRYGCFDEVGFQLEGQGHFAVWICDLYAEGGCMGDGGDPDGDGIVECPCVLYPADWESPEASEPVALAVDLPGNCAQLRTTDGSPGFEADTHNWCSRAVPQVAQFFWSLSAAGKDVFDYDYEDPDYETNLNDCFPAGGGEEEPPPDEEDPCATDPGMCDGDPGDGPPEEWG